MKRLILLVLIFNYGTCLPLEDKQTEATTDNVEEEIQKTVNVVSYIQNFKNIMADYVNTQYKNLTIDDMEKIKITLEEFLINFANDLRETVELQQKNLTFEAKEEIQDGLPDTTFVEIKDRMKTEFPDIKEDTANEIIFKLRKNLFITRQKIDNIINNSEKAAAEYALD
ncbi:uncharacterized protein [Choristoneura fumiferana]|uniref:uncharacterized protein n=1 Tax=Choristoneura fumiferana TaxID=7141 RepID=UPI003D15508E